MIFATAADWYQYSSNLIFPPFLKQDKSFTCFSLWSLKPIKGLGSNLPPNHANVTQLKVVVSKFNLWTGWCECKSETVSSTRLEVILWDKGEWLHICVCVQSSSYAYLFAFKYSNVHVTTCLRQPSEKCSSILICD